MTGWQQSWTEELGVGFHSWVCGLTLCLISHWAGGPRPQPLARLLVYSRCLLNE